MFIDLDILEISHFIYTYGKFVKETLQLTVWEKPHLKQWVGKFLPNGPNGGNIPKSKMLVGFFLPMGKIIL
jgi:hypothetical protein